MTTLEQNAETKVRLELPDIAQKLKSLTLPDVDAVVGVATGGVAFASIVAFWLEKPLHVIHLNYRDENNKPRHAKPTLLKPFELDSTTVNKGIYPLANGESNETSRKHILLVDDVSVSGATLETAQGFLKGFQTTTFVIKGKADFVLYSDVSACILLPWRDI
jgi:hypoxanthine phosphoribosyltransferase